MTGQPTARSARLRVLVVEDNADSAEMMAFLLEHRGHDVRTASSGMEALATAPEFDPQVILCDIGLPGMDGYEIAARLRAQAQFAGTKLVALTGYGQDEDRRRSKEAGFDVHLTKPIEPQKLEQLLASLQAEQEQGR